MKHFLLVLIFLTLVCGSVFSVDFGLLTDQRVETGNISFVSNSIFIPWFSYNIMEEKSLSIYLSGLFSLKYQRAMSSYELYELGGELIFVPEISRFGLRYRPNQRLLMEAGRIAYSDNLGLTAYGLFDGIRFQFNFSAGTLSAGAFYTGLLYKDTAQILMTAADAAGFVNKENYFAPKRFLANIRYDTPLFEFHTISLEALAQFDLNQNDEFLHSQYGEVMVEFYPQGNAGLIAGVLFETMESSEGKFNAAFGALARFRLDIPVINSGINLTGKFSSGVLNETFTAFTPVSSSAMGNIFSETISGLALVSAGYTVRLHRTLFADAAALYFMRTYNDLLVDGNFYGGEIQASVAWQPFDELRLTLGSAAFFPSWGNIYDDVQPLYKIKAGLTLSF